MRRSAAFVVVGVLFVALAGTGTAGARTFTGCVRGEVKDANGVLPGARRSRAHFTYRDEKVGPRATLLFGIARV